MISQDGKTQFSVLQTWFVWAFGAKVLFSANLSIERHFAPLQNPPLASQLCIHPFSAMHDARCTAINYWCTSSSVGWCNTMQHSGVIVHQGCISHFWNCISAPSNEMPATSIFWHHTRLRKNAKIDLLYKIPELNSIKHQKYRNRRNNLTMHKRCISLVQKYTLVNRNINTGETSQDITSFTILISIIARYTR